MGQLVAVSSAIRLLAVIQAAAGGSIASAGVHEFMVVQLQSQKAGA